MRLSNLFEKNDNSECVQQHIHSWFDKHYTIVGDAIANLGDAPVIIKDANKKFKGISERFKHVIAYIESIELDKKSYIENSKIKHVDSLLKTLDNWESFEDETKMSAAIDAFSAVLHGSVTTFNKWSSSKEGKDLANEMEHECSNK